MHIETNIEPATEIRATEGPGNLRSGMQKLATFALDASELELALHQLQQVSGEETRKSVQRLKRELTSFEPSVTVLGQVKAGKTALINAIAGWADLLPSDVNPWTSVVTSLHLTPGDERSETGAKFQFMTEDEWDRLTTKGGRIGELAGRAGADNELSKIQAQIDSMREKSRKRLGRHFELLMGQEHEYSYFDKNLLERYICLGDDFDEDVKAGRFDENGKFADITRSADLYLNCQTVPYRMCLRDTPGVNDTFMMREMVTIQALRDSKTCVVVLSATQALTSVDMALIRMISNLQSRDVIIFVNRVDELTDPANQMVEIEDSIRETLRSHDGPTEAEIVFGSAYWANKVLTGDLKSMHDGSADSLLAMTEALMGSTMIDMPPADLIWEMSGMPRLMQAISGQVVNGFGEPFLKRIASSAVALATSQHAARSVMIQGEGFKSDMSMHAAREEFNMMAERHLAEFDVSLNAIFTDYHQRADRAHGTFVERATHSLVKHLESYGDHEIWEYDPAGLRLLLRSAYSSMGNKVRKVAYEKYEAALTDCAHLLYRGFGPAVEGIQISVPEAPQLPSPVALGQTIALDFSGGWWTSWWRRTRGYQAFSKQFRSLISAETEDFMHQMKEVQTNDIREDMRAELVRLLDDQRNILTELIIGTHRSVGAQKLFEDAEDKRRNEMLDDALKKLRGFAY